jgi:transcriptional regulator with PAS, ATPase and Fis domain
MKKKSLITAVFAAVALTFASGALSQPRPAAPAKEDKLAREDKPATEQGEKALPAQDQQMLTLAEECAKKVSAAMEKWIEKNEITEDRLFSFLYFPVADTAPPKFNTDYDKLADRDFLDLQETYVAKSSSIVFVVTVDKNGYLPTHNRKYSQPLTGNGAVDLVNNRTKRIFNDRTGLSAARNTERYLLQKYQRDTGEFMVDLSVPVTIKGKHWGAVRFGYRVAEGS